MSFIVYDLVFLVISLLAVGIFFYKKRSNFQIESVFYLYRTKIGIKFIDWTGKKFSRLLRAAEYITITCGYMLMIGCVWFIVKLGYNYITSPLLAKELKVPVVFPLIPYLPQIFKLDFLPPFYFTYWIIILAVIAIPHEFAHGIYARLSNLKIKSTGFGFLRIFKFPTPFLAAFVEPDEKKMNKLKKKDQLAIIAAGTFANVVFAFIFILFMFAFMSIAFFPAGVNFSSYSTEIVPAGNIYLNGLSLRSLNSSSINLNASLIAVSYLNKTGYITPAGLLGSLSSDAEYLAVYEDAPAIRSNLSGAIISIGGEKVNSYTSLKKAITSNKPGDNVIIRATDGNSITDYNITFASKGGTAYLGIGVASQPSSGLLGWVNAIASAIKDPNIYYQSKIGDLGIFIYQLLWWIVIVSISVALMNMLPIGAFDGGRFFYITMAGITGSNKIAGILYKIITWFMMILLALMTLKWVLTII